MFVKDVMEEGEVNSEGCVCFADFLRVREIFREKSYLSNVRRSFSSFNIGALVSLACFV